MKKLLLIIDLQDAFLNEATAFVSRKIDDLIQSGKFDDVLFTRFVNIENSVYEKELFYEGCKKEDGKIVIDTHGFSVIDKTQYSAYTPALLNYIKDKQIDQIYLCGLDTDCCVLITAIDFFEHGYDIYVLQDFCASSGGETMHQAGLMIGRRNIGKNRVI